MSKDLKMRKYLLFIILVFVTTNVYADEPKENMYSIMRYNLFNITPNELQIEEVTSQNDIWGTIMETGLEEGSFMLVGLMSGDASIYFSGGGGVIGGITHAPVREAAINLNTVADDFFEHYQEAESYPVPDSGEVLFYILTQDGVFTAKALEKDISGGEHELRFLYYVAQELIVLIQLIEENR